MSQLARPERDNDSTAAIAAYKAILQEVLQRRPSGTRLRLAQALNKARSFITQITNPAYPIGIPAQHLSTIFEICHFSPAEKQQFNAAYAKAHPRRLVALAGGARFRAIHLVVPDFGDEQRNREFQAMVQDYATSLARFARSSASPRTPPEKT